MTSNNTFKMLDAAGIESAIASILKAGKKLDNDIHVAAVSCLAHIDNCGDVRLFNRLYLAMPQGARKAALTAWVLAFGKVKANDGTDKKEAPFLYDKERTTNLPEAIGNPWYGFKPDKAPDEVFDVLKALDALIAKAGKAEKVQGEDVLTRLKSLKAEMAAAE